MAAVGYMDPGNWATDLAGGSRYSYTLIWVLLMSNMMAILLQSLSARLGIVNRRDLAQACHETYPPIINVPLYILAEIAITACDLAEVLGSAIALQLLFGMPLIYGVLLTALDTILLLFLSNLGIRKLEAVVIALVGTIGVAFLIEIFLAQPDWGGLLRGFIPSIPDATALYIATGILGATVMPHNLYLHSALVQTRKVGESHEEVKQTLRWNNIDLAVALNLAFFVNAAILVMAAAVFHRNGIVVAEIQDAHRLLAPLLGGAIAPFAFAIALLASGQSSTITGTLAGQIIMEGYLNLRIRPWLRRLITRLLAIIPAIIAIHYYGENATGDLLVLSQVVLSIQLPFAIVPLIHFVADRKRMGNFTIAVWTQALAWLAAGIILSLNIMLVIGQFNDWIAAAGEEAGLMRAGIILLLSLMTILLLYVIFQPWLHERLQKREWAMGNEIHQSLAVTKPVAHALPPYRHVAVALDFSGGEQRLLTEALRLATDPSAKISLLHVSESPAARILGKDVADREAQSDSSSLQELTEQIRQTGVTAEWHLGTGDPAEELGKMVNAYDVDIIVLGGHGHAGVSDLLHGTTVGHLRHLVRANVLVVPLDPPAS
jgi:manganese transport protein